MTFQLTAWEPPPPREPYEVKEGGAAWRPLSAARLRTVLETHAAYPDVDRKRIDAGDTVRLLKGHRTTALIYVRRRDAVPDRRQLALL